MQPVVQPSASTSGMSLVAIQQLELEQHSNLTKDKRSLKEIQEEERARQVEEDFLRWWATEEARLKAEEQSAVEAATKSSKPRKSKKPKPKPNPKDTTPRKNRAPAPNATPQSQSTES